MDSGKTKCQVIQSSWTFSGLVGAFLDLAIAYLLLCGSAVAYLASKSLGLFGLSLPCPCNGLFGNPNANKCLQRVLVDRPSESISSIQSSAKSKLPFDSIWTKDQNCQLNSTKFIREQSHENVHVELEGEASSSSTTGRNSVPRNETGVDFRIKDSPAVTEGIVDGKGKETTSQRPRSGLRRRRRKAVNHGKLSPVTSYDPLPLDVLDVPQPPFSLNKLGSETTEGSLEPVNSLDGSEAPKDIGLQESFLGDSELSEAIDENKPAEKDAFAAEEFMSSAQEDLGFDRNEKNMIRVLEQALGEEHAVRTALYYELDKERSAAATAADEAMNMILRLQEEKAAVEMEARQYQRIIEAKSSYDAEEMNILKEILIRREQEKHFLEKEVEAYRLMFFGNEQYDADIFEILAMQGEKGSLYSSEDPVLMLQGISDSIDAKDKMKSSCNSAERDEVKSACGSTDYEVTVIESNDRTLLSGEKLQISELDVGVDSSEPGDIHRQESIDKHSHLSQSSDIHICNDLEFQEKGMVFMEEDSLTEQRDMQRLEEYPHSPGGPDLHKKTVTPLQGKEVQSKKTTLYQGLESTMTGTCDETSLSVPCNTANMENYGKDSDKGGIDSCSVVSDKEPHVHDVHVIDDESMSNESSGKKKEQLSVVDSLYAPIKCDSPPTRRLGSEQDISRSSSEITSGLPPLGPSRGKASMHGLRRSSMSALEFGNEAGWLREQRSSVSPHLRRLGSDKGLSRSSTDITSGLPPLGPSRGKASGPDLRRRSMSALDNERLKLESEVEWLRERLRVVQKGREKLSISVEHKDREKVQFKLLEDIASQLREIRQLTEPGKAAREAILPLPSSKVKSKKRRCRSASLEVPGNF